MDILLAFIEGLALIASPCILPILPIVLSAGIDGGKKRPYGLITGFILSFWFFTLLSRKLVLLLGIDTNIIRNISFIILLVFGVIMLSSFLSEKTSLILQNLTNSIQNRNQQSREQSGFWGGFLLGICIGLVWSPCVGPIIAIVLVQTIRQTTDIKAVVLLGAFSTGVGLPMLLITLGGKTILSKLNALKQHTTLIRKLLGVVIILTVLFSAGWNLLPTASSHAASPTASSPKLVNGLAQPYPAPNFVGNSAWINSNPLTMEQLKGKVVLVDFWTYSCVNCLRTLPYITSWYSKYRNQGLVIVGVHSPEFEFEKQLVNVQAAVKEHHIQYPVALDNNLDTFVNFNNQYWPAHYLIDRNGRVVYTHFGEGEYATTENNIRALLGIRGQAKEAKQSVWPLAFTQTPETYLGYSRAQNFQSTKAFLRDKAAIYEFPVNLTMNGWALNGQWKVSGEKITTTAKNGALRLKFTSKKVFLVLGSESKQPIPVKVFLNGKAIPSKVSGVDVKNSSVLVSRYKLYELLNQSSSTAGLLELQTAAPGLSAYAFTFGS